MYFRGLKSISGRKLKNPNVQKKMDPVGLNRKFYFPIKISPKMVPTDLKSIFGRKMRNSNFRPKIDPGGQKSIFGQKIESVIFQLKLTQKCSLEISNRFLVEI